MGDTAQGGCPTCPNGTCPKIDTTPSYPKPSADLIRAAMRAVPDGLSGVTPNNCDGRQEVSALSLLTWLFNRGHLKAAGAWATHRLVTEGKLTAHMIPIAMDGIFLKRDDGTCFSTDPRPRNVLPENGPVPFHQFSVRAKESLWKWWRDNKERGRPGRPKAEDTTVKRDDKIAADWIQARDSGVSKADFAKGKRMKSKEVDAALGRVRKRKARSDK